MTPKKHHRRLVYRDGQYVVTSEPTDKQKRQRYLRESRTDRFVTHYDQGLGCRRIAGKFGVSTSDVYRALKKRGVEMRSRYALSDEEREARVAAMYADYQSGMSLAQVGEKYGGISRQSVFNLFEARGLPLRTKKLYPTVEFNGYRYSPSAKGGYWRRTTGDKPLLHHDVWRFHCGNIPLGYQVIHRDGNLDNNALENLVCLPIHEVSRHYHPPQPVIAGKVCDYCGKSLERKRFRGGATEGPASFARRRYCDRTCFGLDHRKKQGNP
jgi:hypothetical protein